MERSQRAAHASVHPHDRLPGEINGAHGWARESFLLAIGDTNDTHPGEDGSTQCRPLADMAAKPVERAGKTTKPRRSPGLR